VTTTLRHFLTTLHDPKTLALPFVLFARVAVTLSTVFTIPCEQCDITLHQGDFCVIYNPDLSIGIHLTTNDLASGMAMLAFFAF